MFGASRRRRRPATPLNSATANPNATTAAASAFMSATGQNPNKALSSAAAAAALRARPHTPTNVADVQTKRTARRSASVSSSGSAPLGTRSANGHGRLERRGSTSSMTERTFRTPSPHRSSTPTTHDQQPPVPRIPDSHSHSAVNVRAAGVGMQNFRTASQKMGSEPPSYYVQPAGDTSNVRKSDSIMRTTKSLPPSHPNVITSQPSRSDSRSSVNFSYPTAFRPQSPPASPISPARSDVKVASPNSSRAASYNAHARGSQQLVYDPNSRRMVPKAHVEEAIEYQIKQATDKPPKKRKNGASRREGSQPTKVTVARARGTMVDENQSLRELPKQDQPIVEPLPTTDITTEEARREDEPGIKTIVTTESPDESRSLDPSASQNPSPSTHITSSEQRGNFRPSQSAHNPTTIVRDEPPFNDENPKTENRSQPSPHVRDVLDAIPTRQVLFESPRPSQPSQETDPHDAAQGSRPSSMVERSGLPEMNNEQRAVAAENKPVVGLTVRAVSPAQNEELAVSRKKSARVSFDDQGTVVVGDSVPPVEEDSPPTQSPQGHKRAWFSNIGRSKKNEVALDDDEIMKPRPALPSFGSIREKKMRELAERALVRPLEPAYSPAISSSPELRPQSSSTLNDSETTEEPSLGQSSDHAIGALLAQDQTSRNAANISRFREPLPPVVTSIEGSGYSSDSTQGSDFEEHPDSTMEPGISSINSSVPGTQLTQPDIDDSNQGPSTAVDTPQSKREETPQTPTSQQQDIPQISVVQPSPMLVEHDPGANGSSTPPHFDVPGSFPDYGSDISCDNQAKAAKDGTGSSILEPITATVEPDQAGLLPQTTLDTTTPVTGLDDNTGDESDESVYSDAYEDIPDFDSSGFMSLDAIVESPISKEPTPRVAQISERSSTHAITSEAKPDTISEDRSARRAQLTPPRDTDDWDQAKAFWRSLTAEKRRQLEFEATEDAGAEGDREEVSLPVRRSSSKRMSPEPMQPTLQTSPGQGKTVQPESHMRMSLRDKQVTKPASTQSQAGMRKTMRSSGGSQNVTKPSTRQLVSTKAPAPTSISSPKQATNPRRHSSAQAPSRSPLTTQAKPAMQRRGSDGSDSSFKRSRPPPSGAVAFRQTMRQTSPVKPHRESTHGSGRFSLRSLSPAGSAVCSESNTGFASHSPGGMRRTLRSNSESSHEGKRSSIHFPLFMRSPKSSPKSSKWSSRFDDSSDEDEGAFAGFRSRMDDSSNKEGSRPSPSMESNSIGKAALRSSATEPSLSRPATVPELEEDSPDLPDSDDDIMPSPLRSPQTTVAERDFASRLGTEGRNSGAIGTSTLGRSRSGRGGLTPSFTSPALPTKEKRRSLLSRLRLNKKSDQAGKIQRSELIDSAARRDTKLERDRGQLKDLRTEPPSSPKLQKRTSVSRSESGGLQRPTSAGNLFGRSGTAGATERPNLGDRRSFSLGPNPIHESYERDNASVESPSVVLRKRFGALRRMFKLDE
ncbi:hypothetical protein E0Z10_g10970 [Xylaria hypoxylon]|uniref:Uncharacterized protein n=1 Tax=Xylaria hypoxylon TaxID=37992 RepID=A0A4Z0Y7Z9_9PEZI|nr:hypothetical protein E0Z10_g10970 [Xylaria hypoxylon]